MHEIRLWGEKKLNPLNRVLINLIALSLRKNNGRKLNRKLESFFNFVLPLKKNRLRSKEGRGPEIEDKSSFFLLHSLLSHCFQFPHFKHSVLKWELQKSSSACFSSSRTVEIIPSVLMN